MRLCIAIALFLASFSFQAFAEEIPLTILHTNDMHSHYRANKSGLELGGVARLSTLIQRERAKSPNTLLLDGGDWSEGHIYYNLDAGRTSLEILDALGYDATVLGNHDWLNGPDQLIKIFNQVHPKFSVVAANLDMTDYARANELQKFIQPYRILNVGKLRVAVIGLVTYEFIYDKYFSPIEVKDPFGRTRKLAAKIKSENLADLVVVISHNGLATNKLVAGMPNIDIIIHAHDHQKYTQPIVVDRNDKKAILVEAQCWGAFLGKLQIVFDTETKKYSVKHYELLQVDDQIPEDPRVLSMVENYDLQLKEKYGDIFHDHLADTKIDIRREGSESIYGNLLTDAYREATGADVSFEGLSLTSGEMYKGPLNTVDIYNALTAVYSPFTQKSWTITTVKMTGETLTWLMNLVLSVSSYIPGGVISTSGMHAVYDPTALKNINIYDDASKKPLRALEVGGEKVNPKRSYLVALPNGIAEAIDFIEVFFGNKIPRTEIKDTGIEDWKALRDYVVKHSPVDSSTISRGGRITVLQSDVALYQDDVIYKRSQDKLDFTITFRNLGAAVSSPRQLSLSYDKTPKYAVDDPNPVESDIRFDLAPIPAGGTAKIQAHMTLPKEFRHMAVPVYFNLSYSGDDPNVSNDGTWLMVR